MARARGLTYTGRVRAGATALGHSLYNLVNVPSGDLGGMNEWPHRAASDGDVFRRRCHSAAPWSVRDYRPAVRGLGAQGLRKPLTRGRPREVADRIRERRPTKRGRARPSSSVLLPSPRRRGSWRRCIGPEASSGCLRQLEFPPPRLAPDGGDGRPPVHGEARSARRRAVLRAAGSAGCAVGGRRPQGGLHAKRLANA